ncbi:hypothetical protein [Candidatus Pantoea persica]|uniref:hypothetical protein n=1 Tax=Candidatus Pantoea persica TaxID=2518128 RepID=UPI00215D61A8|nr:hypothetical protein [Candidatus Pantoea persica]
MAFSVASAEAAGAMPRHRPANKVNELKVVKGWLRFLSIFNDTHLFLLFFLSPRHCARIARRRLHLRDMHEMIKIMIIIYFLVFITKSCK